MSADFLSRKLTAGAKNFLSAINSGLTETVFCNIVERLKLRYNKS